jgi:hypothetical protein
VNYAHSIHLLVPLLFLFHLRLREQLVLLLSNPLHPLLPQTNQKVANGRARVGSGDRLESEEARGQVEGGEERNDFRFGRDVFWCVGLAITVWFSWSFVLEYEIYIK